MGFKYPSVKAFEQAGVADDRKKYTGPEFDNIEGEFACREAGKCPTQDLFEAMVDGLKHYARYGGSLPNGWCYEHITMLANMTLEEAGALQSIKRLCNLQWVSHWYCTMRAYMSLPTLHGVTCSGPGLLAPHRCPYPRCGTADSI